jgi:two-component system invasion response regulator UvrY
MEKHKKTVQIVEDHRIVADSLSTLLQEKEYYKVIAISETEDQAVADAIQLKPDFVLMDINLKSGNGINATERILKENKNFNIVALSVRTDFTHIRRMLKLGVKGYVTKSSPTSELIYCLDKIQEGEGWYLCKEVIEVMGKLDEKILTENLGLTKREVEVIALLHEHMTKEEISERLGVSVRTVETHLFRAQKKLGTSNYNEMIRLLIEHGIVG